MNKKILIIVMILLFISLIVYIAINDYKNQSNLADDREQKFLQDTQSENCLGVIEGEFSYPSSMVPSGSVVCAKNLESNNYYCTTNQVVDSKYRNKKGYRLEVPRGVYFVSGIFPFLKDSSGELMEYKYSGVNCLNRECEDENASITVLCEKIENIDLFKLGKLNIFKIFF